jgi:hypothetical protein
MEPPDSLDAIHKLIDNDDYVAAKDLIKEARAAGKTDPILSLFEALCVYESGNDVETLRLIGEFLLSTGRTRKRPYARFTAAVCLGNLGLFQEEKELLAKVPDSYPGIKKERAFVERKLKLQKQARFLLRAIVER